MHMAHHQAWQAQGLHHTVTITDHCMLAWPPWIAGLHHSITITDCKTPALTAAQLRGRL